MKKLYTADFETTTDENDCRVWAWGVCEIGHPENFYYGNSIDEFFAFMYKSKNAEFYFHNLKFDSEFLFIHLFENGFHHVREKKDEDTKTFSTLINDKGQFYSVRIIFENKGKRKNAVRIYDSLKILPFSVSQIAGAFNLPVSKLEIDYKQKREVGHQLTKEEIDYLRNDVEIVARALHILFEQGLNKMTQGANALHDYKRVVGQKQFDRWFPPPAYDSSVREAYKGGFTYLNPDYKGKDIEEGLVFDVNSLYPWVLHECPLPYDDGIFFEGIYEEDRLYNVYVQLITCQFELKKGYIPTIQLKNNLQFCPTEYLTSSDGEEVTLCLTNYDLELFFEHYEVYNPVYISGWKFKSTVGLFTDYVDKWTKIKIESTINKNKAMRTLAKLMLNALYGKFALNPNVRSKFPIYDEGKIKYVNGDWECRQPLYVPVGAFVTSHARNKTIRTAQQLKGSFVYADTDSCHISLKLPDSIKNMKQDELEQLTTKDLIELGVELPEGFEVNPVNLGAWKLESRFNRARFLRQKCYVEDWNTPSTFDKPSFSTKEVAKYCEDNKLDFNEEIKKYAGLYDRDLLNITCAGMPEKCYKNVTWENFKIGNSFAGKLQPTHVRGGIILKDIDFTIRG